MTGKSLHTLLEAPGVIMAPGAYDALSARIAAQAGAQAVYMTGFGLAGAHLGVPDVGLMTASEMAERAAALCEAAAPVPVIADGDNGHGGPLNAARLTRAYERAGVQCIQLEDQVFPKRCGHMEGKEIVPLGEAVARIRAAVDARKDPAFKIMARTDARATDGFDEALRRADAYLAAGADILFIEAPATLDELDSIARRFKGVPLTANMVEDGKTPYLDTTTLGELGYKIVLFPVSALLVAAKTLQSVYTQLADGKGLSAGTQRLLFQEYNALVGLPELVADAAGLVSGQEQETGRRG